MTFENSKSTQHFTKTPSLLDFHQDWNRRGFRRRKKKLISFLKLKGVAETSNKPRVEIQQICFSQGEMGHSQLCYILRGVIGQDWTERPSGDNASSRGPFTAAQTAGDGECDSGSSVSWKNLPPRQDFKELKAGYLRIKAPQLKKKKKKDGNPLTLSLFSVRLLHPANTNTLLPQL